MVPARCSSISGAKRIAECGDGAREEEQFTNKLNISRGPLFYIQSVRVINRQRILDVIL